MRPGKNEGKRGLILESPREMDVANLALFSVIRRRQQGETDSADSLDPVIDLRINIEQASNKGEESFFVDDSLSPVLLEEIRARADKYGGFALDMVTKFDAANEPLGDNVVHIFKH